ncbi:histidine phosphatase family protein [Pseudactinotalea sp.]|uniref:histidine phosphatase family protein n=1 Tax=Pseudactinotalea sp. TaxID=1926260 RepID=UPI003B3A68DB
MATRHLYLARHGEADPFGDITETGRQQARLLGERLATTPFDAVWHSPLPRAAATARELAPRLRGAPVGAAEELIDHVPYVPPQGEIPASQAGFFDGYDADKAAAGDRSAAALVTRFARPPAAGQDRDSHELLITHAYQVAWLVRDALDAPPARWIDLDCANAALTTIEYRPGLRPTLVTFNDLGHLPAALRWTGVRGGDSRH